MATASPVSFFTLAVYAFGASSFVFWSCLIAGFIYCLLIWLNIDSFIDFLGGSNPEVHRLARIYLLIVVVFGGLSTIIANLFAYLIRAEGRSFDSSFGLILGGVVNIVLDPILMFVVLPKGNEVLGTSIGTTVSNFVSLFYYIIVLLKYKKNSFIRFRFNKDIFRDNIPYSVFKSGLPACIMTVFENVSFAVLDNLMAVCGVAAQAGLGVAKKLNMLAHSCVKGVSQGVMPLIAYNYAAKNKDRFNSALTTTLILTFSIATLCTLFYFTFSSSLIEIFIHTDSSAVNYGAKFLRILCLGAPFSARFSRPN